jgi:hypothetical protein
MTVHFPTPRINQQELAAALGERFQIPADHIADLQVDNHGGHASHVTITLAYTMPEHEIRNIVNRCIIQP